MFLFKEDIAKDLKKKTIQIEENHCLGRFVDIDVYSRYGCLSREDKRHCFLCNDLSINCMRSSKHSYEEIIAFLESYVKGYYNKVLDEIIDLSIMSELNLEPKFGLVTPNSNGSHKDMNYQLMIKAKEAIKPRMIEMFFLTIEKKYDFYLIDTLKNIGKRAETDMFKATNGINCYKGLIFNLGIMISSYALKVSRYKPESIFDVATIFSYDLLKDYKFDSSSYGDLAYSKFKITGVRGEALSGFANVKKGIELLDNLSAKDLLNLLVYYIIHVEDTTFLKRAKDIKFYRETKKMFINLDLSSDLNIQKLNDFCIANNLSFGGSADLLVVSVFLKKINNLGVNVFDRNNIPNF
jgi:triphosphoribosyl-dephospho-CoA synthetase